MIGIAKMFAPGTLLLAMLLAAVGLLLIRRRGFSRLIGATLLVLVTASYFALALPVTARLLSRDLSEFGRLTDVAGLPGDVTIVVIAGDSEHARVIEGLRLFYLAKPRWMISSGAPDLLEELLAGGVPQDRIIPEFSSRTTHEQAIAVAEIVRSRHLGRVVLVASRIHMLRALATFRAAGVDAVPSASAAPAIAGLPPFEPAQNALFLSRDALYEHAALTYYRRNGWLTAHSN